MSAYFNFEQYHHKEEIKTTINFVKFIPFHHPQNTAPPEQPSKQCSLLPWKEWMLLEPGVGSAGDNTGDVAEQPLGSRINITLNLICCHQFLQYLCALRNILEEEKKLSRQLLSERPHAHPAWRSEKPRAQGH